MFAQLKERFIDWWTKSTRFERDYANWRAKNICYRAGTAKNYFRGMKYILTLDYYKAYSNTNTPYGFHHLDPELLEYTVHGKPIGEHTEVIIFRGEFDQLGHQFHIHDFGVDYVFAATNVEEDALMIALKWGG